MAARDTTAPQLPPDQAALFEAFRQEFDAKLSSLRAWGVAMCVGGGSLGGVVSSLVAPHQTAAALRFVSHLL